jgi:gliding motility associated protien GldN
MKRIVSFFLGLLLISLTLSTFAQKDRKEPLVRDGIYERETIPQRIPIPYPHLRESDMLWTKRVWRKIDLRERMNHPLYYPTTRMHDRISFFQRIMDAIKFNEINAYDPRGGDDEFTTLISYNQILGLLDAKDTTITVPHPITGAPTPVFQPGTVPYKEMKELLIKEEWFFDKQHSTFQVRIIGICPIRLYMEPSLGTLARKQIFWIYYPHARTVLANTAVFNDFNDAQRISFDDLFFKRRFSSYIVQESNVYDNRRIDEYSFGGIPNQQESERIRNDLFVFEHDLWEY